MGAEGRDAALLWDMLDAARTACDLGKGYTFRRYMTDRKLQLAVERLVEIIGEAARRVSEGFRRAHPEIPWPKIIAQRHVIAHEYGEIRQERMWQLVSEHLPRLLISLEPLIPPLPPQTDG
jgi:uncharacterized protein with HEPN domain